MIEKERLVSHRSLAIFIHSGKTGIWRNMKKTKSDKGTQGPFSFEKYLNFPLQSFVKLLINPILLKHSLTN